MSAGPLNPFQRWIAEAARDVGAEVPAKVDPLGLSFETEGRIARVLPHADEGQAVIEVMATALDGVSEEDAGRLAIELLRLNHEARFEHAWSIVLDDFDRLHVTTTVSVSATGGHLLAEILYDGIDRAAALSAVVAGLIGAQAPASKASLVAAPATASNIIRG